MRTHNWLFIAGVVLMASGCGYTNNKDTPTRGSTSVGTGTGGGNQTTGTGTTTSSATFSQVSQILQNNCTSCHSGGSPSAGIDLSYYSGVMSVVSAGNSTGSPLYTEIANRAMPPGGGISSADVSTVQNWIDSGAMNN